MARGVRGWKERNDEMPMKQERLFARDLVGDERARRLSDGEWRLLSRLRLEHPVLQDIDPAVILAVVAEGHPSKRPQ